MNNNTKRKKKEWYESVRSQTGAPPQYIKPPEGHKAKVARGKPAKVRHNRNEDNDEAAVNNAAAAKPISIAKRS